MRGERTRARGPVASRAAGAAVLLLAAGLALGLVRGDDEPAARGLEPAVVSVLVERPGGLPERATGFVAEDHRVVTVAHVLDGGGPMAVQARGGAAQPARVVRVDRAADLALLEVRAHQGGALASAGVGARASGGTSGEAGALAHGSSGARASDARGARVLGARRGSVRAKSVAVRRRIVARVRDSAGPQLYSRPALELAGEVSAGDSGAPVLDGDGRLLGVVFARSRRQAGTAYAVDAGAVDRLLGR